MNTNFKKYLTATLLMSMVLPTSATVHAAADATVDTVEYYVLFDVKTQQQALGYKIAWTENTDVQEDLNGDFVPDRELGIVVSSTNKTSSTIYYSNADINTAISATQNRVTYGLWNSTTLPYWRYVYEVVPSSVTTIETASTKTVGSAAYSTMNAGPFETYAEAEGYAATVTSRNGSILSTSGWYSNTLYKSVRDTTYYSDSTPEIAVQ